jgi:hypothetical protein
MFWDSDVAAGVHEAFHEAFQRPGTPKSWYRREDFGGARPSGAAASALGGPAFCQNGKTFALAL